MSIFFAVHSKLNRVIRTTDNYWNKIVTLKHPVMEGKEKEVKQTIADPDIVKESERDANVCLYYIRYAKRYICVVARHENGTGFIISCYPVDKVKEGKILYEKTKSLS